MCFSEYPSFIRLSLLAGTNFRSGFSRSTQSNGHVEEVRGSRGQNCGHNVTPALVPNFPPL